jgi:mitotic spindle assembly checkpoint protein MAD2B
VIQSFNQFRYQGNVEKLVVVIKDREQVALERFIFSIQNMIEVEPFQKDSRFGLLSCVSQQRMTFFFIPKSVQNAMSAACLGQYFRSFLIKLSMIECQLGQMYLGGQYCQLLILIRRPKYSLRILIDDASFALVLELKDDKVPSVTHGKVLVFLSYTEALFDDD